MNPYIHRVKCEVCGEDGMAHVSDYREYVTELWGIKNKWRYSGPSYMVHTDPTICAENLKRQREKMKESNKTAQEVESGGIW